ncbi:glycosyltransferase [Eubacteriaceae bacterium ES2]|nr:glycosyltransferase [Eubacteriaceae bacterium ES2]
MIVELKKTLSLNSEDHILVSIGRLSQEKNLAQLINLVDKLCSLDDHVKLLIVGGGPEKDHLMKMSAEKGLSDRIIFAGEVAWDRIENYYALGDVFVSASQSETQGLTYLEALSAGKPLLVRKDDCLNNILFEGQNGYAYETEAQFQSAFTKLFRNCSYSEMKAFSQEIAHGISMEAFGQGAEKIYENVVSERSILLEGCELNEQIHSVVG